MPVSNSKTNIAIADGIAAPALVRATSFGSSILEDIVIDYGPPEALNKLFLTADTMARENGVRLSFASYDELFEANRKNQDSWQPLVPIFDPEVGGITDETGFVIVGRNAEGEIIATQAARLYRWLDTNLKEEGENLRLFYADPEKSKLPNEVCRVSAPSASSIVGRTVFPGAVWYRPDYRKKGLHNLMGRVVKGIAFTRWYTDVMFTFMAEHTVAKNFAERSGYFQTEWDVVLENSPWGTARLALVWSNSEQLVDYFFEDLTGHLQPKVDGVVHGRTADQSR